MWIMLDEISFMLFLGCTAGFFVLLTVLLFVYFKMPTGARSIISCWLKKRTLVVEGDDRGVLSLKDYKKGGDEGQLERKDKRGYLEAKIIPRHSNPIISTPYHLQGTGIPTFLSYSGKTIVGSPQMVAAMNVAASKEKEHLPKHVKEWAKKQHVELTYNKPIEQEDGKTKYKETTEDHTIFNVKLNFFELFFRSTINMGQFKIMLKQYYQKGKRDAQVGIGKFAIPIVIIIIGVIFAIFVMSGGLEGLM